MDLPKSWQWQKIRNIVALDTLIKLDPRKLEDGEFQYIDIASIDNQSKTISNVSTINNRDAPSRARQKVENGDILVSTVRPNLNAVAIVEASLQGNLICSTGFAVLRVNPAYILRDYLFAWVKSVFFITEISNKARGASYPAVSFNDILDSKIPLPPLEEQQAIVEILQQAEQLQHLRQDSLVKAEKLASALFLEMFGEFLTKDRLKSSPMLGDFITQAQYGSSHSVEDQGDIPVLRMNSITYNGWLDLNELKYAKDSTLYNDLLLESGDLIFNRTNSIDLVGKTAVWRGIKGRYSFASYLIRVKLNDSLIPEYVWGFLNSDYGKEILLRTAKQAVNMANISASELKRIKIPIPSIDLQKKYSDTLLELNSGFKRNLIDHVRHIDNLTEQLSFMAFSGKLSENWRKTHPQTQTHKISVINTNQKQGVTSNRTTTFLAQEKRKYIYEQFNEFQKSVWCYFMESDGYISSDLRALIAELPEEISAKDQARLQTTLLTLVSLGLIVKVNLPDNRGNYTTAYRAVREDDQLDNFRLPPTTVTLI